jgi:bifunctional DNA-binding transcriptional regulator/antitoxin component of YhaV-PrlF toxin-antitoxin module
MREPYNDLMAAIEHLMTMSRNGQVSIPAQTRARWGTRKVIVVDLGDRVVMRPAPDEDPRKTARRDDSAAAKRRA